MKVKLCNQYCAPTGVYSAGATIDVPDDEAKQLVDGGYAEYADGTPVKKLTKAEAKAQAEAEAKAQAEAEAKAQAEAEAKAQAAGGAGDGGAQ